jgi:hypothetical protein
MTSFSMMNNNLRKIIYGMEFDIKCDLNITHPVQYVILRSIHRHILRMDKGLMGWWLP